MPRLYESVIFVLAILSFIVYTLLLYVIFKLRKTEFESPFFIFFCNLGMADLCRTVVYVSTATFARWGWFSTLFQGNNILASIGMQGQLFFGMAQRINNMLLAANRFTAIMTPIKHRIVSLTSMYLY